MPPCQADWFDHGSLLQLPIQQPPPGPTVCGPFHCHTLQLLSPQQALSHAVVLMSPWWAGCRPLHCTPSVTLNVPATHATGGGGGGGGGFGCGGPGPGSVSGASAVRQPKSKVTSSRTGGVSLSETTAAPALLTSCRRRSVTVNGTALRDHQRVTSIVPARLIDRRLDRPAPPAPPRRALRSRAPESRARSALLYLNYS